jgi:hypothetical protein
MTSDAPNPTADADVRRRANDAAALKFKESDIASMVRNSAHLADGVIETIDMDGALPGGNGDDGHAQAAASGPASQPLSAEQKKIRLQLLTFKHTFDCFEVTQPLLRVGIADIKRGDVIAIETIVGRVFLQIGDRIQGIAKDTGEILCECHYDLPGQYVAKHAASIQLPICSKNCVISNPDGSTRLASRKLNMTTDAPLPPHVGNLLDERFLSSLASHVSPQADKLRPIDLARWDIRLGLKLKALIDENNRRERDKKTRHEAQRRQKKAAGQQKDQS